MKKSILLTALALASTAALACHQPPKRYYPQPEQSSVAPSPAPHGYALFASGCAGFWRGGGFAGVRPLLRGGRVFWAGLLHALA